MGPKGRVEPIEETKATSICRSEVHHHRGREGTASIKGRGRRKAKARAPLWSDPEAAVPCNRLALADAGRSVTIRDGSH